MSATDPRDTPLGRITAAVHRHLVVTVLQALAATPGLVALVFVDRSASNAPLAGLCLLPLGPALSAAVFALNDRDEEPGAPAPARSFLRGYRLNALDALRLWAPGSAALVVIALGLANLGPAGLPRSYGAVLFLVAVLVVVWLLTATVIASVFRFRTRDVARLAAHHLGRFPVATLGTLALLVAAGLIVATTSEAVLALVGGPWTGLLLANARPVLAEVAEHHVAGADTTVS